MSLSISHGAYSGSYGTFGTWRNAVAKAAGYQLAAGADPELPELLTPVLDYAGLPPGAAEGDWETEPEDVLLVLLAHADDTGHIRPDHAAALANRLDALLPEPYDWLETTLRFILACRRAARLAEPLEFH